MVRRYEMDWSSIWIFNWFNVQSTFILLTCDFEIIFSHHSVRRSFSDVTPKRVSRWCYLKKLWIDPTDIRCHRTGVTIKHDRIKIHFKNTCEVASAIRDMRYTKAINYLSDVIKHKRAVPFRRFNLGVGRTSQAKEWKTSQARWPVKSCSALLKILLSAKSSFSAKSLDENELFIQRIVVNNARSYIRRNYRAHGRLQCMCALIVGVLFGKCLTSLFLFLQRFSTTLVQSTWSSERRNQKSPRLILKPPLKNPNPSKLPKSEKVSLLLKHIRVVV